MGNKKIIDNAILCVDNYGSTLVPQGGENILLTLFIFPGYNPILLLRSQISRSLSKRTFRSIGDLLSAFLQHKSPSKHEKLRQNIKHENEIVAVMVVFTFVYCTIHSRVLHFFLHFVKMTSSLMFILEINNLHC